MKAKKEKEISVILPAGAEYLTRKEGAAYLRISLGKFDSIKDIDRIRYGKSVRYSIDALREYARKHTIIVAEGVSNEM